MNITMKLHLLVRYNIFIDAVKADRNLMEGATAQFSEGGLSLL